MTTEKKAEQLARLFFKLRGKPMHHLNDAPKWQQAFVHLLLHPSAQYEKFHIDLSLALFWALKHNDWYPKVLHTPADVERNFVRLLDDYHGFWQCFKLDWDTKRKTQIKTKCCECDVDTVISWCGVHQREWEDFFLFKTALNSDFPCDLCLQKLKEEEEAARADRESRTDNNGHLLDDYRCEYCLTPREHLKTSPAREWCPKNESFTIEEDI